MRWTASVPGVLGVLLTALAVAAARELCPRYCLCYFQSLLTRADCVGRNLATTHLDLPSSLDILDLSRNVISVLRAHHFQEANLSRLRFLHLQHNQIGQLNSLAFDGLPRLEYLDLSNNHLRRIELDTFRRNTNLRTLNVSKNPLGVLNQGSFLTAPSLQELNVAGCSLAYINNQFFIGMDNLQTIIVTDNNIIKLQSNMFAHMYQLRHIDLALCKAQNLSLLTDRNPLTCDSAASRFKQWLASRSIRHPHFCEGQPRPVFHNMVADYIQPPTSTELAEWDGEEEEEAGPSEDEEGEGKKVAVVSLAGFLGSFELVPSLCSGLLGLVLGLVLGALAALLCTRARLKDRPPPPPHRSFSLVGASGAARVTDVEVDSLLPPGTPPLPYRLLNTSFNG